VGVFDFIVGSDIIGYGSCSTALELLATVAELLKRDTEDVDTALLDAIAATPGGMKAVAASMPAEAEEAVPFGDARGWQADWVEEKEEGEGSTVFAGAVAAAAAVGEKLNPPVPSKKKKLGSVFVLGYTRRLTRDAYDINHVLNYANKIGLDWCVADDSVVDIFGNRTDEMTMCMEHCVFLFTWMRGGK
jgi:hypothetical protein